VELDFSPVGAGWPDLLRGALATIQVTAASLGLGCVLGLVVGLGRLEPRRPALYAICSGYVLLIRGTPLLVQLFLLFFGLPQYVAEIVRGAIQSIDRDQTLAAQSLGMTPRQVMRHVVLPQALLRMIPPLGNEFIALIKNSALVSLLTIPDLMHEGQKIIAVSYRSLEVYLAVAAVYLVLTGSTAWLLRRVEYRLSASRRLG
jgi:polar amino acid transport system permease protein